MNMQNLKENAKQFLKIEPIANKETPFIIHHPFIKYNPIIYQTRKGNIKSIDVFSNKELKKYFDRMEQLIDECKTPQQIFNLMTQPYKLYFFYLNSNKLSNNDYNNCLKDIWINTEFPNNDRNISVKKILTLFKKSDSSLMMSKEENEFYNSLPDKVKIYRGTHDSNNYKALSWTTDYETALWFAKRFHTDGYVLEAIIDKKDIIAFFNDRNEHELIIDFTKIKDLKIEKDLTIKI